ncbi:MAG: hypothetical protein ACLP8X_34805 [Streptosporangiaceae bacterium]
MTDEPANAGPKAMGSPANILDRPLTELSVDELMALKAEFESRGIQIHNSATTEQMVFVFIAGNFSSAFIQALGHRAAGGAAKLPRRAADLVCRHVRKKGRPDEYRIGVDGGSAATIVITAKTPDEARLALLDLDITAPELHGKELRWDPATAAWRPSTAGPDR